MLFAGLCFFVTIEILHLVRHDLSFLDYLPVLELAENDSREPATVINRLPRWAQLFEEGAIGAVLSTLASKDNSG